MASSGATITSCSMVGAIRKSSKKSLPHMMRFVEASTHPWNAAVPIGITLHGSKSRICLEPKHSGGKPSKALLLQRG